ncbi:MAG: dipeptide/oligopeptide/nickel ABC transporter ATP-binding protein [Planctomycetota bacterium]|nr:MAG: dipeptide/oligopeptide/nickel ABC transporter ATP-binding protein [Planctomycetota bacterium]
MSGLVAEPGGRAPAAVAQRGTPLLAVRQLRLEARGPEGRAVVVDGMDLEVHPGRVTALVGESGSGKSLSALAVLGLLPPGVRLVGGSAQLAGRGELLGLAERQLRRVRGAEIGIVFQEPMSALNPVMRVGAQVREAIEAHPGPRGRAARARALELLRQVGIPEPELRYRSYPHELSGGMKQRVAIAIALAAGPRVLIADEPTTALDVTVQAQVLELLLRLGRERGLGLWLITHDLGVVAEMADEVVVMYAGAVVERAPAAELFARPLHPYTRGLLRSLPRVHGARRRRLEAIPGAVPPPHLRPGGCRFRNRCPLAAERCAEHEPPLAEQEPGRQVACWFAGAEGQPAHSGRT